jgi:uncharacterized protein (DUF3820 family)
MGDNAPTVIPFGKYKGRFIDEVMIDDPKYLEWCTGQDWFRAKFGTLYQIIINRGAEPQETPEHNAMQVRFLEDAFCLRFMKLVAFPTDKSFSEYISKLREQAISELFEKYEDAKNRVATYTESQQACVDALKKRKGRPATDKNYAYHVLYAEQDLARTTKNLLESQALFEERKIDYEKLTAPLSTLPIPTPIFTIDRREFEELDIDVQLSIYISWTDFDGDHRIHCCHADIELKPMVGDDYPAVLRQMRDQKVRCHNMGRRSAYRGVCFVGKYTGAGATRDQFVQTFKSAGICVVFEEDLR